MERKKYLVLIILLQITFYSCREAMVGLTGQDNLLRRYVLSMTAISLQKPFSPPISIPGFVQDEVIVPYHSIVHAGNSVNLTCIAEITSDPLYTYDWQLVSRPDGSTAELAGSGSTTVTLTTDIEGPYIIVLSLSKNGHTYTHNAYVGTTSVVHYIRAGATGSATGSDWTNAWNALPPSLVRGHTYYIADGTYPGYYLNTPQAGDVPIFIKKAVDADHGTDSGWNTGTMGTGQALFLVQNSDLTNPDRSKTIPFIINTSDIIIDGQAGSGNGVLEPHGMKFYNNTTTPGPAGNHAFIIGDGLTGFTSTLHDIKIKHCEMAMNITYTSSIRGHGVVVHSMVNSLQYFYLQNCYIHDTPGMSLYLFNTQSSLVEGCYMARNHSDPYSHAEGIQSNSNCASNIVRYTYFEDIEGTAIIVGDSNWEVYGNVAFYTPDYVNSSPVGRHFQGVTCNNFVGMGFYTTTANGSRPNNKVYNNTIVGNNNAVSDGGNLALILYGTGNIVYNNIWANCRYLNFANGGISDYNMFYNTNINTNSYSESHIQKTATDPFVDSAGFDYHLGVNTDDGLDLDPAYQYDMDGTIRGSGGIWSRGAYQY